ncbi:MAG: mechanosensitive ion channel [Polyangiales bacterium]
MEFSWVIVAVSSIPKFVFEWLPSLVVAGLGAAFIAAARFVLQRNGRRFGEESYLYRQLFILILVIIVVVLFILMLPIERDTKSELLSLVGLFGSGAIALASTTVTSNALAGLMLRTIGNFRIGDFIIIKDDRGRVTEKGLLYTEIQTETRNLITLPNLYLVQNPVQVIRSSGTFVTAKVSLGYDVPRESIEAQLLAAASASDLSDAFVRIMELGDFSVTYQIAGMLKDVKYLITAESRLRQNMLDSLHNAGIEIVSPTFMNQRQYDPSATFIPAHSSPRHRPRRSESNHPEQHIFDKAENAERKSELGEAIAKCEEEIALLEKDPPKDLSETEVQKRVDELKSKLEEMKLATTSIDDEKAESDESSSSNKS